MRRLFNGYTALRDSIVVVFVLPTTNKIVDWTVISDPAPDIKDIQCLHDTHNNDGIDGNTISISSTLTTRHDY